MELAIHGTTETRTFHGYNPASKTLQALLGPHAEAVDWCRINGHPTASWGPYIPQPSDRIDLWMRPGFGIPESIWIAIAIQIAISVVMFGISYGLGLLLNNRPDPTQPGTPEQTFGIAGLSNTIVLGTPKLLVYGTRRVFGHLIGSTVGAGGAGMSFGALYFMGEGEIQHLRAVEINEIPIADFPPASYEWVPGTVTQELPWPWGEPRQVYYDGRELALNESTIYQTHNERVSSVLLILQVPYLQQIRQNTNNSFRDPGTMVFRIEYKPVGFPHWFLAYGAHRVQDTSTSPYFAQAEVNFPFPGRWQVRVTLTDNSKNDQQPPALLYNAEERQQVATPLTYPHNALLAIKGVASSQITSFEGMKVSALIDGRKVQTWNGATYVRRFTRNRVWVLRDLLTDTRVGMGHRFPPTLWDEPAALDAATYYMGEIAGEPRDLCDVLINQRRPAWDWIRELLVEGNAALVPSRGKLKYIVDRPQRARQAYGEPGSILDQSVSLTFGSSGERVNTVRGEFSDVDQNYRLSLIEVEAGDKGEELLNESTISFKSITRLSQAQRALAYALKKQRNVQRRWVWQTTLDAVPAEPFDVVRLSYLSPTTRYGVTGFLQGGCTVLHLVLDQLLALEASETYEVLVRYQDQVEPVVRTFIATATRRQGTVDVAPALPRIPQPGDRYMVGLLAKSIATVLLDQVSLQTEDLTYTLAGAEYRADIYDTAGTGVLPQTAKVFHDFPALYAEDTVPRYHASYAIDPVSRYGAGPATAREDTEPWPGAQLYRSRDPVDEEYDLSYQGAPLPCHGTALTALPAPLVGYASPTPPNVTDWHSTVDVEVTGGTLTTITWGELQMGFNHLWLGQELLQFRVATLLSVTGEARSYRLEQFRRGLRGTELQLATHASGEYCLLLGTGTFTRDILATDRHRTRNWKSPTIGDDVALVSATPYAVPSNNLTPWPVASPRGRRLQNGTWRLQWRGRARFLTDWLHEGEAVPDYDFVAYELTIYTDASRTTAVQQIQLGQDLNYQAPITYQYSLGQQETDFGAGQTTLYWQVRQIGLDDVSAAAPLVSVEGEGT